MSQKGLSKNMGKSNLGYNAVFLLKVTQALAQSLWANGKCRDFSTAINLKEPKLNLI